MIELLNPIAIVREHRASKRLAAKPSDSRVLTSNQIKMTTLNKRHSDGRIFYGYDKNNHKISHNVSPYAVKFWENIEDGVKGVIAELKLKNWMTLSSCEGHGPYEKAFITIACYDGVEPTNLYTAFDKPFVRIRHMDIFDYANNAIIPTPKSYTIEKRTKKVDRIVIVNSLNQMFKRGYVDYKLINIEVGYDLPHKLWLETRNSITGRISYFCKKMFNIFMRRGVLKKLTWYASKLPYYMG